MSADPFELLRTHVRAVADTIEPVTNVDELIAHITLEHHRSPSITPERAPRRFGAAALAAALVVGIGAGAVATAAVIDRHQVVSRPEVGAVCRPSADDLTSGIQVGASADPVAACGELWRAGNLPLIDQENPSTDPSLVACVGPLGVVEVLPGADDTTCERAGLQPADLAALVVDPLVALVAGTDEISSRCLAPQDAEAAATALLDELGFQEWRVIVRPGEGCGLIAIGGEEHPRVLFVSPTPRPA